MPKSKPKEKRLHFAGYDFTSGPEGTVVHRPTPARSEFHPGDRVEYRDVNLWEQGTVTGSDGKWVMVRWDGKSFESREWAPNLRHVSTGAAHATRATRAGTRHHATKKSPAQLQREINEVLATPLVLHGDRWISQKEAAARGAFDPKLYEKAVAEGRVPPAVATRIAKAAERSHATRKRYRVGGKRAWTFDTLEAAKEHAERIWQKKGVIASIEEVSSRR